MAEVGFAVGVLGLVGQVEAVAFGVGGRGGVDGGVDGVEDFVS